MKGLRLSEALPQHVDREIWTEWKAALTPPAAESVSDADALRKLTVKVWQPFSHDLPRLRAAQAAVWRDFLGRLKDGRLAAYGINSQSGKETKIQRALLDRIEFDIVSDSAKVGSLEFLGVDIRVGRDAPPKPRALKQAPLDKFVAEYPVQPVPSLKDLESAAKDRFPDAHVTRKLVREAMDRRWGRQSPGPRKRRAS